MKAQITIEGLKSVVASYANLTDKAGRQLATAAIRAGLKEIAKEIKKRIDPRIRHVRSTIGYRFKASPKKGITAAKVGFNVGGKKKNIQKRSGNNRGGIGISGQNVFWFIAGTSQRYRRAKAAAIQNAEPPQRLSTGIMPAQQPGLAADAYRASSGAVRSKMQKAAESRLKSIVRRLNRAK